MGQLNIPGRQFAFRLRVRVEPEPDDPKRPPSVRGSLQELGSDQVLYFGSLDDIPGILRAMIAARTSPESDLPAG